MHWRWCMRPWKTHAKKKKCNKKFNLEEKAKHSLSVSNPGEEMDKKNLLFIHNTTINVFEWLRTNKSLYVEIIINVGKSK